MLLTRQALKLAREDRGKLRTFLLTALSRFSHEQHRKGTAQKRGGGEALIEIDALAAEQRYAMEPRDELSPEREFDREWARQLLASVLARLEQAYCVAGKGEVFAALHDHLAGGGTEDYAAAGQTLSLSPAAVRYAAFKLRERYRGMLREAIEQTVTTEEEVAEELVHLRGLFSD